MVIVMSTEAARADIDQVLARLAEQGCRGVLTVGVERTIITVVGPETLALEDDVRILPRVESVVRLGKSYKLAGRDSHPQGTRVPCGNRVIGDGAIALIAGPGAVESRDGLLEAARALQHAGVTMLVGGAFWPAASPYAFRGLGAEALIYLAEARALTGLPVMSEVPTTSDLPIIADHVDVLEIGPASMRNYGLLAAAARTGKPIVLHRDFAATVDEWLLAAEHILAAGNPHVVLCESGIRTYDPATAHTLDLSAVPLARGLTHLPIIVDPAHGTGQAALVPAVARAAVAAGADGLRLQVHPAPDHALVDGAQSLTPRQYQELLASLQPLAAALGRTFVFA